MAPLRTRVRLEQVGVVGDRGTRTPTLIDSRKPSPGLGGLAALRFEAIRQLADTPLDVALVAQERLAEITSTQGPGERAVLVVLVKLSDRHAAHEDATKAIGLQRVVAIGSEDTTPRIDSDSTHVLHTGYGKHDVPSALASLTISSASTTHRACT